MPRAHEAGRIYHVTTHGVGTAAVFRDDIDRQRFVAGLNSTVRDFGWRVFAASLMTTHYHLLVQLTDANLSSGMQIVNGHYARRFNLRHARRGPLFEARYADTPVSDDFHLLTAIRYIALNPVEAKLVSRPEEWHWSTYRQLLGVGPCWPCFEPRFVLDHFPSLDSLRDFVEGRTTVPGTV